jgi:hypothetical protein
MLQRLYMRLLFLFLVIFLFLPQQNACSQDQDVIAVKHSAASPKTRQKAGRESENDSLSDSNKRLLASEMEILRALPTEEEVTFYGDSNVKQDSLEKESDDEQAFKSIKNGLRKPAEKKTAPDSARASWQYSDGEQKDDFIEPAPAGLSSEALHELKVIKKTHASLENKIKKQNSSISSLKVKNQGTIKKLKASQLKAQKLLQELKETRNQLLIAETEIERLSKMIEDRNIANYSKYSGRPAGRSLDNTSTNDAVVKPSAKKLKTDLPILTVVVGKANLRAGPGLQHSPIMTVSRGTRLTVEKRLGTWYRILAPNGTRAWISGEVVAFGKDGGSSPSRTVKVKSYDPSIYE